MNNYIVLDVETTTQTSFKRKANPLDTDNYIVALGYKQYNSKVGSVWQDLLLDIDNGLNCLLSNIDILIGHNLKFDLLYLWRQPILQAWLQQGGKIWDTQLAEYYLTGQQTRWAALRDIAVNKYGCKEREKLMEKYWDKNSIKVLNNKGYIIDVLEEVKVTNNNRSYLQKAQLQGCRVVYNESIDTKDIPKELVLEDVQNDVLDTEKIYLQQYEKAKELGMLPLLKTVMNELLATTEIEYNGMYINKDIMTNNKDNLVYELEWKEKDFDILVRRYWR